MMRVIARNYDIDFVPAPNVAELILCDELPSDELVTSAFGFVFRDEALLMTNLRQRGWDIPGGHRERDEPPAQTAVREVREETGVDVRVTGLIAVQRVRVDGEVPSDYPYPVPESFQAFFLAEPVRDRGLEPTAKTVEARFWPLDEAQDLPWFREHQPLAEAAVAAWRRASGRQHHSDPDGRPR